MDTDHAWAATRKGLVELRRRGGAWGVERTSFLGEPMTMLLPPQQANGRIDSFSVSSLSFAKMISARRRSRRWGNGARAGTSKCP
jgi:hypothetical protein